MESHIHFVFTEMKKTFVDFSKCSISNFFAKCDIRPIFNSALGKFFAEYQKRWFVNLSKRNADHGMFIEWRNTTKVFSKFDNIFQSLFDEEIATVHFGKNMQGIWFPQWLFESRPRQGKKVLLDGLDWFWLCYLADCSKNQCVVTFCAFFAIPHQHNSMLEYCSAKYESYQTDCFDTSYKSTLRVWLFYRKCLVVFKILDLATLLFYCVALTRFCMLIKCWKDFLWHSSTP